MEQIGFIGQGFIGKHMADDFENRGYRVVRYGLQPQYIQNKHKLQKCTIVFIAVPTPTTPDGFDCNSVKSALAELPENCTAVIKSTILPGTTVALQKEFPQLFILHSPEFLREKSAAEDTAQPERNIVGIPTDSAKFRLRAEAVLRVLPPATYQLITSAESAECIKYIGNTFLYTKIVFMNLAHDIVKSAGAEWESVREAVANDSRIGPSHTNPIHDSGRGAGGHCFIKDFEAFTSFFKQTVGDTSSVAVLEALRHKNNDLLLSTQKDLDILSGVYGKTVLE